MAEVRPAEPHVRLEHVTKEFGGGVRAVDDISLSIPRGSFTTLLGPSGCGKTTTLRLIAGFYEPDSGDILLGDRRINDLPAHRRGTAMVFQDYALFPHMTVRENVSYGLKIQGLNRAELDKRVADTMGYLGLAGFDRRLPNQLSGGQQQRVALARALVMNPEVLLLDEPLSNLDARLRVSIRAELLSIQRQIGITTIYVTHDQEEALAMSDWVAVMHHGKVQQWGTPWEIYYTPRTTFMADFVGAVNLVKAPVVFSAGEKVRVRIEDCETTLTVPADYSGSPNELTLAIRPEAVRLALGDPKLSGRLFALKGVVTTRMFLGHLMRYRVRIGEQEWIVDQPDPGAAPIADGEVSVVLDPGRIHIIPSADAPSSV
jgi:ABC-type Fe3+/spermidine/putrescine transport system ATPase subunit